MRMLFLPALLAAAAACTPRQSSPPAVAVLRSGPKVGDRAADFTLPWVSKDGIGPAEAPYQLWGDLGKTVVLAFYPQAFTKTTAAELRTFTEQYDQLFGPDVVVLGISADPVERQSRFAADLGLPFRLLSDTGKGVLRKYPGLDSQGFARRAVYVIAPNGKITYIDAGFDPAKSGVYAKLGNAVQAAKASKPS